MNLILQSQNRQAIMSIGHLHLRKILHHFQDSQEMGHAFQGQSQPQMFENQSFKMMGICIGLIIIVTLIIVIAIKRYYTRRLYQENPENFSNKPDLSFYQQWKFQKKVKSLTDPTGQQIRTKQSYEGKVKEIAFKTHKNLVFFENLQDKDCYFQIEIVNLSSIVMIGFVHEDDLQQVNPSYFKEKKDENQVFEDELNIEQYGILLKTDGVVSVDGKNILKMEWKLQYGDTIGIGMTKHENIRRVWITRNGKIENPPTTEQTLRFIEVGQEENAGINNVKKSKKEQNKNEQAKTNKAEVDKKIEIKSRSFSYYAIVASQYPMRPQKDSVVDWNLGASSFRLHDGKKFFGILK